MSPDSVYMNRCIDLARQGLGKVNPNPLVGCVVVRNKQVISEGFHRGFGESHAEKDALSGLSDSEARGSTLYCNLEPCVTFPEKKTSACSELIISKGIKEVVIGSLDPNPKVRGNGAKLLQEHGVKIRTHVLQEECESLNKAFYFAHQNQIPFITIKVAQTLDGRIATDHGDSKWISNEESREYVHSLRARHDGILVGKATLIQDNAKLTVRKKNEQEFSRTRICLGSLKEVDPSLDFFSDAFARHSIWYSRDKDSSHTESFKAFGANIQSFLSFNSFWKDILGDLYKRNVLSLFVEGGEQVISSLLNEGYYNEFITFITPKVIGNGKHWYHDQTRKLIKDSIELQLEESIRFGSDIMLRYTRKA